MTILEHPEGRVKIEELSPTRRLVSVELYDESTFLPHQSSETSYPVPLIERILSWRGPARLCYSILRDEDPGHLHSRLEYFVLSYVDRADIDAKRLLDFGCGSGASTVALGQTFPHAHIVAVDLEEENVAIARMRTKHHGLSKVDFVVSPNSVELPDQLGTFDFIFLTAVYEHLLPNERRALMPRIWQALRPGGVLFVYDTPHRYYFLESHTTGLPLLNYLPDRLALSLARRWSNRVGSDESWASMLRSGIRGATETEILNDLERAGQGVPALLRPARQGLRDGVDVWYAESMARRPMRRKRAAKHVFKAMSRLGEGAFVPSLSMAIRKT